MAQHRPSDRVGFLHRMGRTPAFPGGTHRVSPVGPSMGFAALSAHPQLAHPGRVRRRNDSVSFLRNFGRAGAPISAPTLRSGKLDRSVKSRFFRRSNFLAIRGHPTRRKVLRIRPRRSNLMTLVAGAATLDSTGTARRRLGRQAHARAKGAPGQRGLRQLTKAARPNHAACDGQVLHRSSAMSSRNFCKICQFPARATQQSVVGIVRPSVLTALRLMTSSLLGRQCCWRADCN
jgi:hypothetical protein